MSETVIREAVLSEHLRGLKMPGAAKEYQGLARQARDEGIGLIASDERLAELVRNAMWAPRYYPYRFSKG